MQEWGDETLRQKLGPRELVVQFDPMQARQRVWAKELAQGGAGHMGKHASGCEGSITRESATGNHWRITGLHTCPPADPPSKRPAGCLCVKGAFCVKEEIHEEAQRGWPKEGPDT
jgi:hypothetical protein